MSSFVLFVAVMAAPVIAALILRLAWRRRLRRRWLATEHRQSLEAVRGHKLAHVVVAAERGDALLIGVGPHRVYGVEADAVCFERRCRPPGLDCGCGFYAFAERADALALWQVFAGGGGPRCTAALTVELSGDLLVYERGYRASEQRVLRVEFSARCAHCVDGPAPAEMLVTDPPWRPTGPELQLEPVLPAGYRPVYPACAAHGAGRASALAPATLAGLLGTEVGWASAPLPSTGSVNAA